ncbi:MAG: recombinase family protein [Shewanella sp.]|uniref:recombinase family protein n=1 Tax=Shewanella sp. TaxID=50422 RepID=UPI0026497932|nr:recombinase family protein [Shewanella sp.]MDN5501016.1 recombinase family protein [Shewanella sp.]MDN5529043.1 recombinase family protein [Shewanella sp.]
MVTYIYARVSAETQNIESQVEYLKEKYVVSNDFIYAEKLSGKSLERPVFNQLKSIVKSGDSIVVQDLSRLGRNTTEVLQFIEEMKNKEVGLIVDDLGRVDVTSATGKMVVTTLAAVATMQREQILEKQALGIAKAKEEGKFKGRQQSPLTVKKCKKAFELVNTKGLTKEDAARAAGVGIATFYRFIRGLTKQEIAEMLIEYQPGSSVYRGRL